MNYLDRSMRKHLLFLLLTMLLFVSLAALLPLLPLGVTPYYMVMLSGVSIITVIVIMISYVRLLINDAQ